MDLNDALSRVNPFQVQWNSAYFVGREEELRIFEDNLAGLAVGQQSHLLVAGIHGTGKTFYLNKLVEVAKTANSVAFPIDCPESTAIEQARSLLRDSIDQLEQHISNPGTPVSTSLSSDFDKGEQSQLFSLPRRRELSASDLQHDFDLLAAKARAAGRNGIVICVDEGQRIERTLLSCLKNAISRMPGILIVLSWRLASDTGGPINQARIELLKKVSDTDKDKDIGTVSFFSSTIPMGPFKTDMEIHQYFGTRLQGKALKFPAEVISRLGEISDRVPRPMTDLAHDVYESGSKLRMVEVDISVLNECFRTRYPVEVKLATDLCSDLSAVTTAALKALCRSPGAISAIELVKSAFLDVPEAHQQVMSEGVGLQLDKLRQTSPILTTADGKFDITESRYRYALRLALSIA